MGIAEKKTKVLPVVIFGLLLLAAWVATQEEPYCSSAKCPGTSLGAFIWGECWCVTKPEP